MKRILLLVALSLTLLLQGCGASSFLKTSARVHSLTRATRGILESAYDDKLLSRETTLEIARPLQRFQAKQVEVFELWKRHRNPDTGDLQLTPEIGAEIAAILVSLKSDFASLKAKSKNNNLPSPATIMIEPALSALESSFNDFAGYLGNLNGVSNKNRVWRILKAENAVAERLYADMLTENGEVTAWIK